jgi:hypothetical protein
MLLALDQQAVLLDSDGDYSLFNGGFRLRASHFQNNPGRSRRRWFRQIGQKPGSLQGKDRYIQRHYSERGEYINGPLTQDVGGFSSRRVSAF